MHFGKIVGGFVLDFCACLCLCYFACLLVCGVLFYFILCQYPLEKMYRLFVQREGCFPEKVILFCFVLFSALFCFLLCFICVVYQLLALFAKIILWAEGVESLIRAGIGKN